MKKLSIIVSLILIIFSIVKIMVKPPTPPKDISGTYALRVESEGPSGAIQAIMQITMKGPTSFDVQGIDQSWSGSGNLSNGVGFYTWQFPNGDTGRTDLHLGEDGYLHGQVRGDKKSNNWDYVAVPKAAN